MIELLLEPLLEIVVWLASMVVRALFLVLVWLPSGAIAGIMARDVSPDVFMWQAIARVASVLLVLVLAAAALWPGVGASAVWLVCVGLGAVVFACGYVAEHRHVRQASGSKPPAPDVEPRP
jgi:hypothetical protein